MAFKGTLQLGQGKDEKYNLLRFSYSLNQRINSENGRPVSIAKGGVLHLTVETSNNTKLLEWMLDPSMTKSGTIQIDDRAIDGKSMRTIEFDDAYCVNYNEVFNAVNSQPMISELVLSARRLNFSAGSTSLMLENEWPGKFDSESRSQGQSTQSGSEGYGNPSEMY